MNDVEARIVPHGGQDLPHDPPHFVFADAIVNLLSQGLTAQELKNGLQSAEGRRADILETYLHLYVKCSRLPGRVHRRCRGDRRVMSAGHSRRLGAWITFVAKVYRRHGQAFTLMPFADEVQVIEAKIEVFFSHLAFLTRGLVIVGGFHTC